jgi:hypothetical protein
MRYSSPQTGRRIETPAGGRGPNRRLPLATRRIASAMLATWLALAMAKPAVAAAISRSMASGPDHESVTIFLRGV